MRQVNMTSLGDDARETLTIAGTQLDIVLYVRLVHCPLGPDDVIQLRRPSFSILPKLSVCKGHLPFAITDRPSRCLSYHINKSSSSVQSNPTRRSGERLARRPSSYTSGSSLTIYLSHFSHHLSQSSTDENRHYNFQHSPRETRPEPQNSNKYSAATETTLPET